MIRLLIVFGTTDGHTAKIVNVLTHGLQQLGAQVDAVEAKRGDEAPAPQDYDGVIVAASVHRGGYQRGVRTWVRAHSLALAGMPTAFLSVCLAVMEKGEGPKKDLERITGRMVTETGWTPTLIKQVAGALPYSRYGWLKRVVMRHIVRKAGVETDPRRDYEYTDWEDIDRFLKGYLWSVRLTRPGGVREPRQAQVAEAVI